MSIAFRITINGNIDGVTPVVVPTPLPPQDADGVVAFTVSNFGILGVTRLQELLGVGGLWLVALGYTAAVGVTEFSAGLVRPSSFTDMQAIFDRVDPTVGVPSRAGPYMPAGWRLRATAFDAAGLPVSGTHTIYANFQGVTSFADVCAASKTQTTPVST